MKKFRGFEKVIIALVSLVLITSQCQAYYNLGAFWRPSVRTISLDRHSEAEDLNGNMTVSLSNVTAGDLITCEVSFDGASGNVFSSVTDPVNGIYETAAAIELNVAHDQYSGIFYVQNAGAGTYSVTLGLTQSANATALSCQAWKNVATSSALDTNFTQFQYVDSTANANTGSNKTPTLDHELVIASATFGAPTVPTAGGNYTLIDALNNSETFPEYWIQPAATATNGAYTSSSDSWTDQMVAFIPTSPAIPITLDTHGFHDAGVQATLTTLSNVTAGDLITCEIAFAGNNGNVFSSITDPVNGYYTATGSLVLNPAGDTYIGIYYMQNAAAGSYSVSLNLLEDVGWYGISCQAWKNAATSSALDSTFSQGRVKTSTTNATTGANKTPSANNELVIAAADFANVTPTAGTNYALIDDQNGSDTGLYPEYWLQTTATATNGAYVSASDDWSDQMVAFVPTSQSTPMILDVHSVGTTSPPANLSTILSNVTAGDLITCEASFDTGNGGSLTSLSDPYNGSYLAAIPMENDINVSQANGIYYFQNAATGNYPITMTVTQPHGYLGLSCQAWKGAATSSSLDTSFTQSQVLTNTANATTGGNKTPVSNQELVIAVANFDNVTPTAGTNYTLIDVQSQNHSYPEYWVQTNKAATNGPFTSGSDTWLDQMAGFRPHP